MNTPITESLPLDSSELLDLFSVVRDETATPEQFHRLEALLRTDDQSATLYVRLMRVHALFERYFELPVESDIELEHSQHTITPADSPHAAATPFPSPLSTLHSPLSTYFSSGWPVAYLIATVVFAIGLTVAAFVHVSQPVNLVRQSTLPSPPSPLPSTAVARITGMVDCVWESGQRSAISGQQLQSTSHYPPATNHSVSLGDRLALRSGLLEITYDTGARVILQGPVTYEVESPSGGYLSIGKLTARLDKKAASGQWSVAGESETSSLSTIHDPLFTIKTPTALVTDLGTEFGVEVDQAGATESHVFRGLVRVQALGADGKPKGDATVLRENESATIDNAESGQITVLQPSNAPTSFVRTLPMPRIKTFDLVDVVAGGNGSSGQRSGGIDPTNGRATATPPEEDAEQIRYFIGDGKYHRVEALSFVDGVFIPDGRSGPIQIDSAGHTFAGFPKTSNQTVAYICAGGKIPAKPPFAIETKLSGDIDYAVPPNGLLFLHSNKGITFDLRAIRRANPGCKLLRFRTIAGNTETAFLRGKSVRADVWVLVDGQSRFQRREFSGFNGAIPVTVSLHENDTFLTLVATDGGDEISYDWIMFGNPRIELQTVEPQRGEDAQAK